MTQLFGFRRKNIEDGGVNKLQERQEAFCAGYLLWLLGREREQDWKTRMIWKRADEGSVEKSWFFFFFPLKTSAGLAVS